MKNNSIKAYVLSYWFKLYDLIRLHRIKKEYSLHIMTSEQTIAHIKKTNCSIARYGDGEFDLMMQVRAEDYQEISDQLAAALRNVFSNRSNQLLICLPHPMVSTRRLKKHGKNFWRNWCLTRRQHLVSQLYQLIGSRYRFGDAFVSRPYSGYKSRKYSRKIFTLLRSLWDDKDILIVEGQKTCLGVGNDLLDNAKSIKRIICPAENAFNAYDQILEVILSNWDDELVLLALGPTATILASDLSKNGIQALDIGHIDIQYEWYLAGKSFVPVNGKYTNEARGGRDVELCSEEKYRAQVVAEVKTSL